jgi:hypothetical protein
MDTKNNDIKPISYELPYALDITLYKHNYYDNLIINNLKRNTRYEKLPDSPNSFIVTAEDFRKMLSDKFKREVNNAQSLTEVTIKEGVNSIYFLDKLFMNFNNLEFIKVNVSEKRDFTRLLTVGENRSVINFDYRIITSVLDISKLAESEESLELINELFIHLGLIEVDEYGKKMSYFTINAQDLLLLINSQQELMFTEDEEFIDEKYLDAIEFIYDVIDQKCENDNSKLIILTDFCE